MVVKSTHRYFVRHFEVSRHFNGNQILTCGHLILPLFHLSNDGAVVPDIQVRTKHQIRLLQHLDGQLAVRLDEGVRDIFKLITKPNNQRVTLRFGDLEIGQTECDVSIALQLNLQLRFIFRFRVERHVHAH